MQEMITICTYKRKLSHDMELHDQSDNAMMNGAAPNQNGKYDLGAWSFGFKPNGFHFIFVLELYAYPELGLLTFDVDVVGTYGG